VLIRARKELGGRSRPALFCGRRLEILLNLILIFLLLPHLHRFLFSCPVLAGVYSLLKEKDR
jgi:hypothetical protein